MLAMRIIRLIALLSLLSLAYSTAGEALVTQNPYKVKAAFLRNFAHYVSWPYNAFADSDSAWCIAVLGPDPFGEILETTLAGRSEQGRPFEIVRASSPKDLPPCQIVFVAYSDSTQRRTVLSELKNKPVLTVGDAPQFLEEGGIIRFQVGERIRMGVNLDEAKAASLNIQTKMLEVASEILENGAVRQRR